MLLLLSKLTCARLRFSTISRMLRHSCCEVRVMQLHDILQLRTSVILPEAISDGGLAPTTDTSLFLTTYRGGSHLPSDIHDVFFIFPTALISILLYGIESASLCTQIYFSTSLGTRLTYCPIPGVPVNSPLSYTRFPLRYVCTG